MELPNIRMKQAARVICRGRQRRETSRVIVSTPLCAELPTLQQQQQQLYHVSDQDGLHLCSAQVAQDVGGKQRRHLQDKHDNTTQLKIIKWMNRMRRVLSLTA